MKAKYIIIILVILLGFFILLTIAPLVIAKGFLAKPPKVKKNSVLVLTIGGELVENAPYNPMGELLNIGGQPQTMRTILNNIDKAKVDKRISGIFLNIKGLSCGWAKIEEIRDKLMDFKKSGKFLVAFMEYGGEKEYYLALPCDEIYITEQGFFVLDGLTAKVTFYKRTLNKLGIEPEVENIGKYKSAGDIIKRDSMSEAHREVVNSLLDDFYGRFIKAVSERRKINMDRVIAIIDSGLIYRAQDAVKYNFIDGAKYEDEVIDILKKKNKDKDKLTEISSGEYSRVRMESLGLFKGKDKIAIVYAVGSIVSGRDSDSPFGERTMGSESTVESIRSARDNKSVKAIVLRIDSPGGSGLASDVIWREVHLAREKKPVIVSMSDVAGSGGYYIAMGADAIVAQPGTITGSIGVVSSKLNMAETYNKIGFNTEVVKRGKFADMYSEHRGFTEEEWKKFKDETYKFYYSFVDKASKDRKKTWDELHQIAQGRVWTGNQALQIGLVDKLGGLDKAILLAKEKAKIKDEFGIVIYPRPRSFLKEMLSYPRINIIEEIPNPEIRNMINQAETFKQFHKGEILAIMPYEVVIE